MKGLIQIVVCFFLSLFLFGFAAALTSSLTAFLCANIMSVQRFEARGRRFTNFHYYYFTFFSSCFSGLRLACLLTALLIALGTAIRCITTDPPAVTWYVAPNVTWYVCMYVLLPSRGMYVYMCFPIVTWHAGPKVTWYVCMFSCRHVACRSKMSRGMYVCMYVCMFPYRHVACRSQCHVACIFSSRHVECRIPTSRDN